LAEFVLQGLAWKLASVLHRMRALTNERRRFGYRRLHILLSREGHRLNHKKPFRLPHRPAHPPRPRMAAEPYRL